MTQKLRDGTVIPANLNVGAAPNADTYTNMNISLKEGIVTAIIYPNDPASVSKKEIEYNVAVVEYQHRVNVNLSTYKNVRLLNLFGTVNDYVRYTLQPSSTNVSQLGDQTDANVFEDGARVLVMCTSGVARTASCVIIGGLQHRDASIPSSSDGQFYDFTFNGIKQYIDKDGAFTLAFNSATDQTGKQANSAAAGTMLKIDKAGHFIVVDNKGQTINIDRDAQKITVGNGSESVVIDKGAKSITMTSGGDETLNATGKLNAMSGADMNVKSGAAMNVNAGGAMNVQSGGAMQTQVGGQWQLQAQGNVQITAMGEVTIMGAAGPVIASQGPLTMVGLGDVPVATVGTSICQGIGNLGLPVISTIITGSFTCFVGT